MLTAYEDDVLKTLKETHDWEPGWWVGWPDFLGLLDERNPDVNWKKPDVLKAMRRLRDLGMAKQEGVFNDEGQLGGSAYFYVRPQFRTGLAKYYGLLDELEERIVKEAVDKASKIETETVNQFHQLQHKWDKIDIDMARRYNNHLNNPWRNLSIQINAAFQNTIDAMIKLAGDLRSLQGLVKPPGFEPGGFVHKPRFEPGHITGIDGSRIKWDCNWPKIEGGEAIMNRPIHVRQRPKPRTYKNIFQRWRERLGTWLCKIGVHSWTYDGYFRTCDRCKKSQFKYQHKNRTKWATRSHPQ